MESFIAQKCNELALGSLERDSEIKQQISQELEAYYNMSLVKSLKDQIDILESEVYFLREELREKNNLFKILMKSKISDNKCHNIYTNTQNDKIPESAPSELRHNTTNKNNHKNFSKNETDEKINDDNIKNSMANNISFNSERKNDNKNNGNKNKGNCIDSNEGNSNSNNNNNSSSKENNMKSSSINSKINIKNINNNSKENNINSNGGDSSTNNKQKQARNEDNSISNNNNNSSSKENNINSSNINSKTRKTAFIIGDSIVKKIDGYLLTSSINHRYIVKVRPFFSAKMIDMVDYIKPTQRDFNPDVYLLHFRPILSSNKFSEQISLKILNVANSLKLDNNNVIVLSIVPRDDENKKKVDEVNIILEELCKANNVVMISHRNINPKRYLNRSRLHLKDDGVSLFVRNFRDFLNNFDKI